MATLKIIDVIDIAMTSEHTSSSWQIATDGDFDDILLDIVKDVDNLLELRTVIRNHDGTIYEFDRNTYGRVKMHYDEVDSTWFTIGVCDNN